MFINIMSPSEMEKLIATRAQKKRLSLNISQQTLSERSGVPYGTLKKFERTGQISLSSLLKIALTLGEFDHFDLLFTNSADELPVSLDSLLAEKTRKRGRQ